MRRAAAIAIGGAWIVALCAGSFFTTDDHIFAAQARALPFGWHYLSEPIYDHFSPWHRLADHVVTTLTTQGWWLAMVISLAWYAGCVLVFASLVRRLVGDTVAGRIAIGLFALSPVFVQSTQWWALSAQLYPETFFGLLAIRLALDGRRWWAVAAYALALCGFIKALLVFAPLVVIAWRLRDRWLAAGTSVVTVAYFAIISGDRYYHYIPNQARPTAELWAKYFVAGWGEGIAPLLLDGSVGKTLGLGIVVVVVGNLAIAWLVWRTRSARVWILAAAVVAGTLVLAGGARLGAQGVESVTLDLRYQFEAVVALLLAGSVAWGDRPVRLHPALLVIPLVFAVVAGLRLQRNWFGPENRAYFEHFAASYERDPDVSILDGFVPEPVVPAVYAPSNMFSTILPNREPDARIGGLGGRPATVDFDGRVRPVRLRRVTTGRCPVVPVGITGGTDLVVATITGPSAQGTVVADSGIAGGPVVNGFRLGQTLTTVPPRLPWRGVVGVGPVKALTITGDCTRVVVDRVPLAG